MKKLYAVIIIFLTIGFLFHCQNDSKSPAQPTNSAPSIESIESTKDTVKISGIATLNCVASDPDGDNFSYVWSSTAGTIITMIGNQESVTWLAPNSAGTYSISCKVIDQHGAIDSAHIDIEVMLLPISTQGLIGYWPIIGNADDESGYDNHGSSFMAPLFSDRFGKSSSAFRFYGVNEFISMGNNAILKPQLPATIVFWMKTGSAGRNHILSTNYNETNYFGFFLLVYNDGRLKIAFGDGGAIGAEASRSKYSIDTINVDTWYHVAAVFRGETDMDIYINGINNGGTYAGFGTGVAYDNGNFNLGRLDTAQNDPPQYFNGVLDEITFFNRALTEQEVQKLYQTDW